MQYRTHSLLKTRQIFLKLEGWDILNSQLILDKADLKLDASTEVKISLVCLPRIFKKLTND